ncbi:MAG: ATP-dependent RecD-like DNA helicase [Candidatus Phytoplasma sp.]|nr:ATP-dependent RecD-like DNA helicase [Phytoplasma sp.]
MLETITGSLKSYLFHNEDNGYSIAKIELEEDQKIVTIVGYFPRLNDDVTYAFSGQWVTHSTYGQQFKVESFKQLEIQSKIGLVNYLSSSFFTGIGPKTALKIVETFGEDAIEKIISNHTILKEVGLNPIRSKRLYDQILDNRKQEEVLVQLYGYGLTSKVAMKLLNAYGDRSIEKLKEDPYRLMYEIEGFGFLKAHDVAKKFGLTNSDERSIKAAIIYVLETMAFQQGHLYATKLELAEGVTQLLNEPLEITSALEKLMNENKVIFEQDFYFLTLIYHTEVALAAKIAALSTDNTLEVDENKIKDLITFVERQKSIQYTEKQKLAILTALKNPMTIITGGPGTGKTTIIDGIIKVYQLYYGLNFKENLQAALMAPTGRASKRMKELLDLPAQTIHRQLGYNFDGHFTYGADNPLREKLLIIDEASMIDIFLAKRLFDAIRTNQQVIIVGDEDQLPSVGPGNVLGDLIASNVLPVVKLNEIHRQAQDSHIISLAQAINRQDLQYEDLRTNNDVFFKKGSIQEIKETIVGQIKGAMNKGYSLTDDIQILIPMYKGDIGIDEINKLIQKEFNPQSDKNSISLGEKTYYLNDKVIQLVNDPEKGVMNGDIGLVKEFGYDKDYKPYIEVSFDENKIRYYKQDLEELNLAYAISIHKSQGSEYPIVILPIIRQYLHMLKKELIYTAITRAKKYLLILGDMNLLTFASNQLSERRRTTLKDRLRAYEDDLDKIEGLEEEDDITPFDF